MAISFVTYEEQVLICLSLLTRVIFLFPVKQRQEENNSAEGETEKHLL